jgi:hypothetical protein
MLLRAEDKGGSMLIMSAQLIGMKMCPHCAVSSPLMRRVFSSEELISAQSTTKISRADGAQLVNWAAYSCSTCGGILTAMGAEFSQGMHNRVRKMFPEPKQAHEDLPEMAKNFLQQAFNTLHAPDAASVMAGSAVDAMLKA